MSALIPDLLAIVFGYVDAMEEHDRFIQALEFGIGLRLDIYRARRDKPWIVEDLPAHWMWFWRDWTTDHPPHPRYVNGPPSKAV